MTAKESAAVMEQKSSTRKSARASEFRSGTADLADEIYELDQSSPGWDHNAMMAGVERAIKTGFSRDRLVRRYGEKIVKAAERAVKT